MITTSATVAAHNAQSLVVTHLLQLFFVDRSGTCLEERDETRSGGRSEGKTWEEGGG